MSAHEVKPADRRRQVAQTLAAMVVLGLFFVVSSGARDWVGIELTAESIREAVQKLGWWAPAGYLALVTFRQAFALPSMLALGSAGLLFGAGMGAVIGGIGTTLNALVLFGIARSMGRDRVMPRLHARFPNFEDRARTAGPLVIALATGHPLGPQTAFHFGAGIAPIRTWVFAAVVLPAALFRAACYAYLGANILEPTSSRFWLTSAVLILLSLAPLAHPKLRERLFGRAPSRGNPAQGAESSSPDEPGEDDLDLSRLR